MFTQLHTELRDDWKERKAFGRYLSRSYQRIGYENKSSLVLGCGNDLTFHKSDSGFNLHNAFFCRNRLCPMCGWRREKKLFSQVMSVMDIIKDDYQFIMLTLTVPNVDGSQLESKLRQMSSAFSKLMKRRPIQRVVKGFFRAFEVTYNRKHKNFHPHIHCICAVPKNYFSSDFYLHNSDWLSFWRSSMQDDNIKIVDIRKVRAKKGRGLDSAVCEVAKYTVKPNDYIFPGDNVLTDKIVSILDNALYRKRLVAFGGCFKSIHDDLGLDDVEDGDLIHVESDSESDSDLETLIRCRWSWKFFRYEIFAVLYLNKTYYGGDFGFIDEDSGELLEKLVI